MPSYDITAQELRTFIEERETGGLKSLVDGGGVVGLAKRLQVDLKSGISLTEVEDRQTAFGANRVPERPARSYMGLLADALNDRTIWLLCIAAAANTIIAIIEMQDHPDSVAWIEGVSIFITVALVANVAAVQDWRKEKQFRLLNAEVQNVKINVMRDGQPVAVSKYDVVVGDIVRLTIGDILESDGVLVEGADVEVDESALTGEPILVKKNVAEAPFMLSGTTIQKGQGRYIVSAVGVHSENGRIQALVRGQAVDDTGEGEGQTMEDEQSVLTVKLDHMANLIGKAATGVAVIALAGMVISYAAEGGFVPGWDRWGHVMNWVITTITIVVVAVPEGLPLAVTLALSLSVRKMQIDNNLVKHLDATETMGSATTICSDKTGTLTQNRMTVTQFYVGGKVYAKKGDLGDNTCGAIVRTQAALPHATLQAVGEGICLNKAEAEIEWEETTKRWKQTGNKTDCALLAFAQGCGQNYVEVRKRPQFAHQSDGGDSTGQLGTHTYPFSSGRKRAGVVVRKREGGYRLYMKGASEVILALSSSVIGADGTETVLSEDDKRAVTDNAILYFARNGMRTIGLAYRDFPDGADWEQQLSEAESATLTGQQAECYSVETKLTLLGVAGIEDPVRDSVAAAIDKCCRAGIDVRMVTGDHQDTAVAIAKQCGIVRAGIDYDEATGRALKKHMVMTGEEFRRFVTDAAGKVIQDKFDEVWPELRVLARSSPTDKYVLVTGLRESDLFATHRGRSLGIFPDRQVVAVTGDGTNDAPALKKADVGFAMGITGTRAAQDAADVILLDDDFASIVQACIWGRNVYDSIAKFLQFQLTVNISAVTLATTGAFAYHESPLRTVQMLWVNLIMDSLGALALASEPPVDKLLERPPYGRNKSLISFHMSCNMLGQAFYQLVVLVILLFAGGGGGVPAGEEEFIAAPPHWIAQGVQSMLNRPVGGILGLASGQGTKTAVEVVPTRHYTLIFHTFVLCQLCNWINCRKLYHETWVFRGILQNTTFCTLWVVCFVFQAFLVEGGRLVGTVCTVQEMHDDPELTYCVYPLGTTNLTGMLWLGSSAVAVGSFVWQGVIIAVARAAFPNRDPMEVVLESRTVTVVSRTEESESKDMVAAGNSGKRPSAIRQSSRVMRDQEEYKRRSSLTRRPSQQGAAMDKGGV